MAGGANSPTLELVSQKMATTRDGNDFKTRLKTRKRLMSVSFLSLSTFLSPRINPASSNARMSLSSEEVEEKVVVEELVEEVEDEVEEEEEDEEQE